MKRLLLALLLVAVPLTAQKKQQTDPRGHSSVPPIIVEVKTPPKTEAEIAESTRTQREQEKTNRRTVILTAVIALAALLQFGGLVGQIRVYRKQAKIMSDALAVAVQQASTAEQAAAAAQKNADALMNGDRAWISVLPANWVPELRPVWEQGDSPEKMENPFHHAFPAIIKNVGKTPARIEKVYIHYILTQYPPKSLSEQPVYINLLEEPSFVLVPNEETPVITYLGHNGGVLTRGEIIAIQNRQAAFLYAYGMVQYKDVYDRPQETRFGYVYHFPQGGMINIEKTGFRRGGPELYNRQT